MLVIRDYISADLSTVAIFTYNQQFDQPMIPFFRRLRQKLLVEQRFSKYLIYAIGEIILVVIGILIAVQINDWNETRKIQKTSRTHLEKMILELETTKTRMEYLTTNAEGKYSFGYPSLDEVVPNCDSLLKLSYAGITEADIPFIVSARFFGGRSSLNVQQDAFEEAKSGGRLNSLGSEELVTAIKLYNARVDRESGYTDKTNSAIARSISKLEDGLGKLLLDHSMDPAHFDIANYPWLFDRTSKEYQDLQTGINNTHIDQAENREKMLVIYALSDSLILQIQEELSNRTR